MYKTFEDYKTCLTWRVTKSWLVWTVYLQCAGWGSSACSSIGCSFSQWGSPSSAMGEVAACRSSSSSSREEHPNVTGGDVVYTMRHKLLCNTRTLQHKTPNRYWIMSTILIQERGSYVYDMEVCRRNANVNLVCVLTHSEIRCFPERWCYTQLLSFFIMWFFLTIL